MMKYINRRFFIFFFLWYVFLDKKPPKEWPQKGQIQFKNFYLRYSVDTPHVLKNLNITIESMEKVIFSKYAVYTLTKRFLFL